MISINFFNILATIINVLVLFLLVQKFLVKPLMNVIQKREDMINSHFEEARTAEADAKNMKAQYEENLKNAKEESLSIIDRARGTAQAEYDRIVSEAGDQAKSIISKAQADMELEKEQALREVRTEIGDLVALAAGKVAGTKTSAETDRELIDKFLADVDSDKE